MPEINSLMFGDRVGKCDEHFNEDFALKQVPLQEHLQTSFFSYR